MNWLRRARRGAGWMVLEPGANDVAVVHGEAVATGSPRVHRFAIRAAEESTAGLRQVARELNAGRFRCATLLDPADYQIMLVDAPSVPRDELKSAMRWRVKDLLDFHIDDVTLDILDIPAPEQGSGRHHMLYAIAARNEAIRARIGQFQDAGVSLAVIDIPETAQRNIGALYEEPNRGVAVLHFNARGSLFTINYRTELYLARRFEVSVGDLTDPDPKAREDTRARILLELQRSLDHFERQFPGIPIARLLLAPEPAPSGLVEHLAGELGMRVETVDLNGLMTIAGGAMEAPVQWRLFHLLGASLRHEQVAL